ncbi:hypothetical protein ACWDFR_22700 [Streptomyces sp. 900105755]
MFPTSTIASAPRIVERRSAPSPSRPMVGVARPDQQRDGQEPLGLGRDTWSAAAMVGISGAPRLLITATTELR